MTLRHLPLVCLLISLISPPLHADKAPEFVIPPTQGSGPFPVALWLHGFRGYSPEGYFRDATREKMQAHADAIGAVIVGFPATTDLGDNTQCWSEETVADHAYIQDRLKKISTKAAIPMDLTRIGLFGFSQGAKVAADLASCYPEHYRGAILLSPGGIGLPQTAQEKHPAHDRQVYYCLCGAKEHPYNVELTKSYAQHLKDTLGARVTLTLYPDMAEHTRPPDFIEKFPLWMSAILKGE